MRKNSTPRICYLLFVLALFYCPTINAQSANCFSPNAGEDHIYCEIPSIVSLSATPLSQGQTGVWTQTKGSPTVIENQGFSTTRVTNLQNNGGPYCFVWTISGPDCQQSDTISMIQTPTWAFEALPDLGCASSYNPEEDVLVKTAPVAYNSVDDIKVTLTFLTVPDGVQEISVYPQITGSSPGTSQNESLSLDAFNDGSPTDIVQLGVPFAYNISAKTIKQQATATFPLEEISFDLLFDKYQARGKYKYSITISNSCGSNSFERFYTNSGFSSLVADAGQDQYLGCGETSSILGGTGLYYPAQADPGSIHAGIWYTIAAPGSDPLNASNRHLSNPTIDNLVPGVYTFRYMSQFGSECQASFDDINVEVNHSAPTSVSAFLDQAAVCGTGVAQLIGLKEGDREGTWAQLSPAVTTEQMVFGTTTDTVNLTNLEPYTNYTIQYSYSNDCGTTSTTVVFRTGKFTGPSIANIEEEFACTQKDSFNLLADPVASGYANWEVVSAPAGVTPDFSAPTSNATAISNLTADGIYVVKFSIFTIPCYIRSNDYITIVKGEAPLLAAGSDILDCQATFPKTVNMSATAATTGEAHWSFVSGPSVPSFLDQSAYNSAVTFQQSGTYVFEWVSKYSRCSQKADQVVVRLGENASTSNAGQDQESCGGDGSFTLDAQALGNDETGVWTVVSTTGNVGVSINDRVDPESDVVFSNSGEAVLRWTVTGLNNVCHASDDVTLRWVAAANTISDLNLCEAGSAELFGNTYLGLSNVDLAWTMVSGPSTALIESADQDNTVVSDLVPGTYVFSYTVTAVGCNSEAEVTVNIVAAELAQVGVDKDHCEGDFITLKGNDSATATSKWYLVSGPNTGSFVNENVADTDYGPVQENEVYTFAYSLDNGTCITYDYITVNVMPKLTVDMEDVVYVCNGDATLTPSTTAPGYTGAFEYQWSNGATTQSIDVPGESIGQFQVTVTAPGFCPAVSQVQVEACLPITLSYFKGELEECRARIYWESLEEINVAYFKVEKSSDGINYRPVGSIEAIGGEHTQQYEIWDDATQNINYYRLKIINSDQSYEYYKLLVPITTNCYETEANSTSSLYPNPTSGDQVQLKYFTQTDEVISIELFDATGIMVGQSKHQSQEGGEVLTIDIHELPVGIFYVKLSGQGWEVEPKRFVKVK